MDGKPLTYEELLELTRCQGRDILEAVGTLLRHGPGHVLDFDHVPSTVSNG